MFVQVPGEVDAHVFYEVKRCAAVIVVDQQLQTTIFALAPEAARQAEELLHLTYEGAQRLLYLTAAPQRHGRLSGEHFDARPTFLATPIEVVSEKGSKTS